MVETVVLLLILLLLRLRIRLRWWSECALPRPCAVRVLIGATSMRACMMLAVLGVVVVVVGRVGVVWAFGDLYFKTLAFDGETIEALNRNFGLLRGLELDEAVT